MNFKEFFKPTKEKIALTVALFLVGFLTVFSITELNFLNLNPIAYEIIPLHDYATYHGGSGYPLAIYTVATSEVMCPPSEPNCKIPSVVTMNYFNILIDIVFWYLVSCIVMFAYGKYRGNKK